MVERSIESEVVEVFDKIKLGNDFILEGGAGSGKTYSLISIIQKISIEEPHKSITCITFTNNAVSEIKSRINNDKLYVSTIHTFIWQLIKRFQIEIKDCLVELINNDSSKVFLKPKEYAEEQLINLDYFTNVYVDYDETYSMKKDKNNHVKISHEQVLILAEKMFSKFPKLCDILIDTSNYIFVDEYQDTSPLIIKILLEHIKKRTKKNIVGFFGDSMQAIYDDSDIKLLDSYKLAKIYKRENRRNPSKIIELANKFRLDKMQQIPSDDVSAPNMENKHVLTGTVKFVYGKNISQIEMLRNSALYTSLGFNDQSRTKELRLTHRLNADTAGFPQLFQLYHSDLFIKLFEEIKGKIKGGTLSEEGSTFEELCKIAFIKKQMVIQDLENNKVYQPFFNEIRNSSFQSVSNKVLVIKESLLSYKFNGLSNQYEAGTDRDRILRRLDIIYELIELYSNGNYNDFLKKTKFQIDSLEDKIKLSEIMQKLSLPTNKIEDVIKMSSENHLVDEDDLFDDFIENKGYYLWNRLKEIPFEEFKHSISYLREYVSVLTQHKVKGSEYDNVLVLLDNGRWNQYDFRTLFGEGSKKEDVINRTRRLFYVTITRAMKNLIIYMPESNQNIIENSKNFFDSNDIIDIQSLN